MMGVSGVRHVPASALGDSEPTSPLPTPPLAFVCVQLGTHILCKQQRLVNIKWLWGDVSQSLWEIEGPGVARARTKEHLLRSQDIRRQDLQGQQADASVTNDH